MRMQMLIAILLASSLAGCVAPSGEPPARNDQDTSSGSYNETGVARLLAISTSMSHAGAGGVQAIADGSIHQPARCVLLRGGVAQGNDNCTVHPSSPWRFEADWYVSGSFEASGYPLDDPRRYSEKTILAFDGNDTLVALWNGATDYHPDALRAIE